MDYSTLVAETFINSPALIVLQIPLIGIVIWLFDTILNAFGKGNIAHFTRTLGVLAILYMSINLLRKVLTAIFALAGINM